MAHRVNDWKNYKSSVQRFRLSVALAKKYIVYIWVMIVEQTFQKCFCQSTRNDFCFVCVGVLHVQPIGTF